MAAICWAPRHGSPFRRTTSCQNVSAQADLRRRHRVVRLCPETSSRWQDDRECGEEALFMIAGKGRGRFSVKGARPNFFATLIKVHLGPDAGFPPLQQMRENGALGAGWEEIGGRYLFGMSRGCRPLEDKAEEQALLQSIEGTFALRNRALCITGLKTSLRVSELLALKVSDVFDVQTGRFRPRVYLVRKNLKGKKSGRSIPLNKTAAFALGRWFVALRRNGVSLQADLPVFLSRQGGVPRAIDRSVAFRVMKSAARKAGLEDGIGTHTWRKTAAQAAYRASGHDLLAVSKLLGHRQIGTTVAYLSWNLDAKADRLMMEL